MRYFPIFHSKAEFGSQSYQAILEDKTFLYVDGMMQKEMVGTSINSALISISEIDRQCSLPNDV